MRSAYAGMISKDVAREREKAFDGMLAAEKNAE